MYIAVEYCRGESGGGWRGRTKLENGWGACKQGQILAFELDDWARENRAKIAPV